MAFGAANVVGGYAVTDRMLHMFRARPKAGTGDAGTRAGE
jgi:NAD(P) transhydrogenase subunit alpha